MIILPFHFPSTDMRRDVQDIFRLTPHEKQVMMFSATLSKDVRPVCKKFMQDVSIRASTLASTHARALASSLRPRAKPRKAWIAIRWSNSSIIILSPRQRQCRKSPWISLPRLSSHPRYIGGSLCLRPLGPFLASLFGFSKITDFSRARQKKKIRQRKKKRRPRKKKIRPRKKKRRQEKKKWRQEKKNGR